MATSTQHVVEPKRSQTTSYIKVGELCNYEIDSVKMIIYYFMKRGETMIYPYKESSPKIDPTVFIADYATITGDVTIGAHSSIWFNTVIRGDVAPVVIGEKVSIQDLS